MYTNLACSLAFLLYKINTSTLANNGENCPYLLTSVLLQTLSLKEQSTENLFDTRHISRSHAMSIAFDHNSQLCSIAILSVLVWRALADVYISWVWLITIHGENWRAYCLLSPYYLTFFQEAAWCADDRFWYQIWSGMSSLCRTIQTWCRISTRIASSLWAPALWMM